MTRLEGMNLEEDTKKAIGNNYTLISQRTSAAGKTNAKRENRNKILDEGDQKLTIEMQRLSGSRSLLGGGAAPVSERADF